MALRSRLRQLKASSLVSRFKTTPRHVFRSFSSTTTWPALHRHARYGSLIELASELKALGSAAEKTARTVTPDSGLLPLQLCRENTNFLNLFHARQRLLLPFTASLKAPKLSVKINLEELKEEYKNSEEKIQKNIIMAAQAVNQSRDIILESNTHPSSNNLRSSKYTDVAKKINTSRLNRYYENMFLNLDNAEDCYSYPSVHLSVCNRG